MKDKKRNIILCFIDMLSVVIGFTLAVLLIDKYLFLNQNSDLFMNILIVVITYLVCELLFGLNHTVWSQISFDETIKLGMANSLATILLILLNLLGMISIPNNILITSLIATTLLQYSVRALYRMYRIVRLQENKSTRGSRVLIYGAGSAGKLIAREILENEHYDYNLIGFIDDKEHLKGTKLYTVPVLGGVDDLTAIIKEYAIDEIFFAIPSLNLKERRLIIEELMKEEVDIKVVSSAEKLLKSTKLSENLKPIDIADLLERGETVINDEEVKNHIKGQSVMVTGAGGSIGSELVRQIVNYKPKRLILIDMSELALYTIEQELNILFRKEPHKKIDFCAEIASITDEDTMREIFERESIDLIFHAAAYKHVPLMEKSAKEAIKNNIFGTKILIDLADKFKVKKFTNISTDKAVNPTNVMGATKRFIEMMLQAKSKESDTQYVAVRFGNVLGSNGSAVPLFREQIAQGGPVTVTHKDIERYFMTIPEAVSLVLQASSFAEGGEIYVLDMGEPVKILHLAEKVIQLSGYEPYKDIDIVFTGLRPGEKLYEELFMETEELANTDNDLIRRARPMSISEADIKQYLKTLISCCDSGLNNEEVKYALQSVVSTYEVEGEDD